MYVEDGTAGDEFGAGLSGRCPYLCFYVLEKDILRDRHHATVFHCLKNFLSHQKYREFKDFVIGTLRLVKQQTALVEALSFVLCLGADQRETKCPPSHLLDHHRAFQDDTQVLL